MQLTELFQSLPAPTCEGGLPCFSTLVIEGARHRLAKDENGAPALLVVVASRSGRLRSASIELEHVSVQHDVICRLWRDGQPLEEVPFTVVRCRQADRLLRHYFLRVIEGVLPVLGPDPGEDRVREVVDSLAVLFRALMMPPGKSIQGLWAELLLIADCSDAHALVQAWHATPGEAYDFSAGVQRIEVKSTASGDRRHHFSLMQLHPPAGTRAFIASMFVERSGGGVSVADLMEHARCRVISQPGLILRIDHVVAASLGQNWRNGLDARFDWERAQESLRFFDSGSIPSLSPSVPPTISEVRFKSDLSSSLALEASDLLGAGGLFQAAVPLRSASRR